MIWKIKMKVQKLMLIHQCSWLNQVSLEDLTLLKLEQNQKEDPGKDWLTSVYCQTIMLAECKHLQVILNNKVSLKDLSFCVHYIILASSKVNPNYLRLLLANRDQDQFKNSLKYKLHHNHHNNGYHCLQQVKKVLSSQLLLQVMVSAKLVIEKINI